MHVEGIHGSRHSVDEFWLIIVHKTVDSVGIGLDLFSLLDHSTVWLLLGGSSSKLLSLPQGEVHLISKNDPLLILERLDIVSFFDARVEQLLVVGLVDASHLALVFYGIDFVLSASYSTLRVGCQLTWNWFDASSAHVTRNLLSLLHRNVAGRYLSVLLEFLDVGVDVFEHLLPLHLAHLL